MRLSRLRQRFGDGTNTEGQIVIITTTGETYLESVLRRMIPESDLGRHKFTEELFGKAEDQIFGTWPERLKWLNIGFDVPLNGTPATQNMLLLVEIRNAIAHGGGSLTTRQTRDLGAMLKLQRNAKKFLDIQVERDNLYFGPNATSLAFEHCRNFILASDEVLRKKYGTLDI